MSGTLGKSKGDSFDYFLPACWVACMPRRARIHYTGECKEFCVLGYTLNVKRGTTYGEHEHHE